MSPRRSSLISLSLTCLAITARAQEDAAPEVDAGGSRRRRSAGLGASNHEWVSSEPLTFEYTEPAPVNRERALAEAEIEGSEFDWMEDYDVLDDEAEGEGQEWVSSLDEEEDGEDMVFDSTYDSVDGENFYKQEEEANDEESEGYDEIGPVKAFNQPIARRLRRITPVTQMTDEEEKRRLAEKEKMRAEYASVPFLDPEVDGIDFYDQEEFSGDRVTFDEDDRRLNNCNWNQESIKVEFKTDRYGYENHWLIQRANGSQVTKRPLSGKFEDNKLHTVNMCLNPGTYRFKVFDSAGDGMQSCNNQMGNGLYRFFKNGSKRFTSPADCNDNWKIRIHTFTVRGGTAPVVAKINDNNNNNNNNSGCKNVQIQMKVDQHGKESSIYLKNSNGSNLLQSVNSINAYQTATLSKCVSPGTYTLKVTDKIGDGIGNGWYKMKVDGQVVVSGQYFTNSKSHQVKVGFNWRSSMSTRDTQWLNSHNDRRRKYNGGKGFVAMRWSSSLASDAKKYAETLGNRCNLQLTHATGISDGENLARNTGSGSYANQYTTEQVMGRWVEQELNDNYPKNAHYTQVVWRATQYVGCGESVRDMGNNKKCMTQVCRYTRAGNCNVSDNAWRAKAWADSSTCGRECPGTCFI